MLNEFKDLPSNKAIRGCPKDKLSQTKKNLLKKGAFFTKYASTNPLEDSAETFVYFVLANAPPKPGVSEANDKVLLFYKDKKMVKIRQSIRNNFKRLGIYPNMTADEIKKLLTRLQTYNPN
ncbi:hypothetical protein [Cardinium endosymbiont of Sogatella furcifera]|uniref:hypothetical protein n=1 Tax=Cardinium endosymbiont of Sogatella furcifera TaxID=650378 RepID=UPI0013B4356B|nr:hypothetical protein [Cardinium endosymbiont of Sogatella furcifera]